MKYFLIAGEASGDLHASNLMKELIKLDPQADFRFMGGELMQSVSGTLVMHYRETSYMMLDVLLHLGKIFGNMRQLRSEIRSWQPDVVIPVDYPGFNLRISRFASSIGLRVFYFISPKVWAWRQRRVEKLKRFTNRLFVILPFEPGFFHSFGIEAEYFGNPLVDAVHDFEQQFAGAEKWAEKYQLDDRPVVALLAGSRKKEIETTLPLMLRVAEEHPDHQFIVAGAPSMDPELYSGYLHGQDVKIVFGETYALLKSAKAAMVNSGTATLETALFGIPQLVLYRTGILAYHIAKRLIKVNFVSLVNLILGRGLVREIIQKDMYRQASVEMSRILSDPGYRSGMETAYREIRLKLGDTGVSKRIAQRMIELLKADTA